MIPITMRGVADRFEAVRSTLRAHPIAQDALLALLLFVLTGARFGRDPQHTARLAVLQLGLLTPLVWRRRNPPLVFAVIAATAAVGWTTHQLLTTEITLLVAFYTLAAYSRPRLVVAAAAVLEIGAVLTAIRFAPSGVTWWAAALFSGMIAAAGMIGINMRTRRAYLAALEDRATRLERERDQRAQLAVADERARIAREMHDVVAHHISVMIALAHGAQFITGDDPGRAGDIMGRVSDTGRQALDEMRRLLGVLRDHDRHPAVEDPATVPQPTLADLDDLLARVRSAGVEARLSVTGTSFPLAAGVQLVMYRLVQEALTNTLKHANATAADVRLCYDADHGLTIDVTDDGRQSPSSGGSHDGHGITGMRERAALLRGTVDAGPLPGQGWRVRIHLSPQKNETRS